MTCQSRMTEKSAGDITTISAMTVRTSMRLAYMGAWRVAL